LLAPCSIARRRCSWGPLTRRHPAAEVLVAGLVVALVAVGVLRGVHEQLGGGLLARQLVCCVVVGGAHQLLGAAQPVGEPLEVEDDPLQRRLDDLVRLAVVVPELETAGRGAEDGRRDLQPPEAAVRQVPGRVVQRLHCLVDHRLVDDEIELAEGGLEAARQPGKSMCPPP